MNHLECPGCRGTGDETSDGQGTCPDCRGTGKRRYVPTTDTGTDLLAQVLSRPEDDNVRLVYADWLQENGEDDRAEFVRLQCRIAAGVTAACGIDYSREWRMLCRAVRCEGCNALRREWHLLHGDLPRRTRWVGAPAARGAFREVHGTLDSPDGRPMRAWNTWARFARGLVCEVQMEPRGWLTHAADLLAAHPVETVRLLGVPLLDPADWYLARHATVVSMAGHGLTTVAYPNEQRDQIVRRLLAEEWPRITFLLDANAVTEAEHD